MLNKLIGYEFKSTRRIFLPAYAVIFVLSLLNGIFMLPANSMNSLMMPLGVLMTIYILAMFAVCILTFAYMINRFYKNLLGDEGYLMFTLPARPSQLIWAKCITSSLWMLFTTIVCSVSVFVLIVPLMISEISFADLTLIRQQLSFGMHTLWQNYSIHLFFIPLLAMVVGIVWIANFCMHIYACLSVGSLANKHRLGFAFLAYLGFSVLSEILMLIVMNIANHLHINIDLNALVPNLTAQVYVALLLFLLFYIIKLAINFVISNYILTRHLNLQ